MTDVFKNVRCEPIYPKTVIGYTLEGDIIAQGKNYIASDGSSVHVTHISPENIVHGYVDGVEYFWDIQGYVLQYPAFITPPDVGNLVSKIEGKQ